jgi:hypothetical protein
MCSDVTTALYQRGLSDSRDLLLGSLTLVMKRTIVLNQALSGLEATWLYIVQYV